MRFYMHKANETLNEKNNKTEDKENIHKTSGKRKKKSMHFLQYFS